MLPILHLNGYKISGPTVLGARRRRRSARLLEGHGYEVHFVEGDDPPKVHREFAATLDSCYATIRAIQTDARANGIRTRPRWPAIVLRTPKGWTGPKVVDGVQIEGTFRAHQVPLSSVRENPEHLKMLEEWMRSYRPDELFDERGAPEPEIRRSRPRAIAGWAPTRTPTAATPDRATRHPVVHRVRGQARSNPAASKVESTRPFGKMLRDIFTRNAKQQNFRLFCPDETNSNRLGDVFEVENRCLVSRIEPYDDHVSPDGRVMEVLSEHSIRDGSRATR